MTPEEYLNARAEETFRAIKFQNSIQNTIIGLLFYVPPEKSYLLDMKHKNLKLKRMNRNLY